MDDIHTSQQTTLLSKTGFRPVFAPLKRKGCLFVFIRKQKGFEPSQNRASRNAERKSSEKSKYF